MSMTLSLTRTDRPVPARCDVLGVGISPVNMELAVQTIQRWVAHGSKHYACITGVHGVIESQSDPKLKAIHNNAGMVTPDGMPMVWINHLRGFNHVDRVYGPDLMLAIFAASVSAESRPLKHYFYGGGEGVADKLAARMQQKFPGLQVVGTYCPPFRKLTDDEDRAVIERINRSEADIVWVGLSTPKQEFWMSAHLGKLDAPAMIGVGAAFDFHAGLKRQAPRWMQRSGLEWFFRLCTEPRRLWKRYLRNNPLFIWYMLLQWLNARDFGSVEFQP